MNEQETTTRSRARWIGVTAISSLLLTMLIIGFAGYLGGIQAVGVAFQAGGAIGQPLAEALPSSLSERLFPRPVDDQALVASGVIQADQVALASEFGGRVAQLFVADGDKVNIGDQVLQLDTSLVDAKIEAAQVAVAMAEAAVARAKAGARPGQLKVAEAQLAQALTGQLAATLAVSDTLALVESPQDILTQIAVTRARIDAAAHEVAQAMALKDAAEMAKNRFGQVNDQWGGVDSYRAHVRGGSLVDLPEEYQSQLPGVLEGTYNVRGFEIEVQDGSFDVYKQVDVNIPLQFHLTPNDWWQAWVGVNAATAREEGLQASLSQLYRQYAEPISLQAQASQAAAALAQADAQVAAAQAQVDGLKAGATAASVDVVEAQLEQAQAVLNSLLAERELLGIVSSLDGLVVDVLARPGEVVAPGAALVTVADLADLRLTVYVPENQVGLVRPNQEVQLFVDGYPDRAFAGHVVRIADQAQFTPRNITTIDERINLVFAVELHLDNADGLLKPGMAAEAFFSDTLTQTTTAR
ncbi:MAG: efflux RND transporter periplasmic adaptor subunit [Chloroflexota bacterium]|nr:MAG: efflux RND transporter periplasmic adaptor subunit [Chloroflexota bacterium]